MKGILLMERCMEMEKFIIKMVIFIKDHFIIISMRETQRYFTKMEQFFKEFILLINVMENLKFHTI